MSVVGLNGEPLRQDEVKSADVRFVCENAKALREVVIVGRSHDGQVVVSGSMANPGEALWMLETGRLWFLTGGQVAIAQASCSDDEPGA